MKVRSLMVSMLACAALAGCSNDEVVENAPEQNEGGKQYLAVNLAAANTLSRAFEDGTDNEAKVAGARFYFFNESGQPFSVTEDGKNFIDKTFATNPFDPANDNEESRSDAVLVIEGGKGSPASMVAVLNQVTANLDNTSKSLSDLEGISADYRKFGENEFLMTNSVYLDANEEEKMEAILAPENLATTPEAAKANPVIIHVERVLAKVKYTIPTSVEGGLYDTGVTFGEEKVYAKIHGLGVAHENPVSNLFKKIDTTWDDTTLGFTWNDAPNYRSYWANSATPDAYENGTTWNDTENKTFTYCLESTNAPKAERTEALVTATLVHADGKTPFEIAEWMGERYAEGEKALKTAMANYLKDFYYNLPLQDGQTEASKESFNPEDLTFVKGTASYEVKAELSENAPQYYTKVDGEWKEVDKNTALKDAIAKLAEAMIWKTGMTYYYTPIKHLGNEGTDGEYGIVRNHLYNVTVNSITGLGTPVYDPDVEIPTVIPDPKETYIAAQIHVLSWNVVTNNVDLGK